ncbi:MAG: hypothetical protein M8862_10010 [marine benthic group bacterium]|jgi:hypothetical protein|nr:hypothetical protein [Gemmatimonadota bacterium]
MLRNRTLPIVALLAGAMMFGACADDVTGPPRTSDEWGNEQDNRTLEPITYEDGNWLLNDPDGNGKPPGRDAR